MTKVGMQVNPDENEFTHILYEMKMYLVTYGLTYSDQIFTNLVRANHAIHLRNLAYFFCRDKKGHYWHVSDFVNDRSRIRTLSGKQFSRIGQYASGATGHLVDDRVSETYKKETRQVEEKAFPHIVNAIQDFLQALEADVVSAYEHKWNDPCVCQYAAEVERLCKACSDGRICTLTGSCHISIG